MKLGEKQEVFALSFAELILRATEMKLGVRIGEVWRPPEMAEIYAEQGKGIINSNHRNKLAADIVLARDGTVLWDGDEYRQLAAFWRSLSSTGFEHCWGGDFKRRDVYHYSIKHRGVV